MKTRHQMARLLISGVILLGMSVPTSAAPLTMRDFHHFFERIQSVSEGVERSESVVSATPSSVTRHGACGNRSSSGNRSEQASVGAGSSATPIMLRGDSWNSLSGCVQNRTLGKSWLIGCCSQVAPVERTELKWIPQSFNERGGVYVLDINETESAWKEPTNGMKEPGARYSPISMDTDRMNQLLLSQGYRIDRRYDQSYAQSTDGDLRKLAHLSLDFDHVLVVSDKLARFVPKNLSDPPILQLGDIIVLLLLASLPESKRIRASLRRVSQWSFK